MSDFTPDEDRAHAIDAAMVEAMNRRRVERQERRQADRKPAAVERRKLCAYCFQPGDHATPAACLRALER